APQGAQARPPLASWAPAARGPASPAARLPPGHRHRALPLADRAPGASPVTTAKASIDNANFFFEGRHREVAAFVVPPRATPVARGTPLGDGHVLIPRAHSSHGVSARPHRGGLRRVLPRRGAAGTRGHDGAAAASARPGTRHRGRSRSPLISPA